jgi:ketosteroid isomerase-like protein
MSEKNVEVVKASYEAFARGGLDRYMEPFADDVVYRAVEGLPTSPVRSMARTPCGHGSRTGSTCSTGTGWSRWN